MPDDKNDDRNGWATLAEGWAIAFIFPASIGAGFLLGWGGDTLFHTSPWMKIIGTALGITGAFVSLFKVAASADKNR